MRGERLTTTRWPGRAAVDLVLGIDPAGLSRCIASCTAVCASAILEQRLKPGARLPSTRALATTLGLARNTVHGAYDQLLAEGYLETRHGSGTYVAASLPDEALRAVADRAPNAADDGSVPRATVPSGAVGQRLSNWGRRVAEIAPAPYGSPSLPLPIDFRHGRPDVIHFPIDEWRRAASRQLRQIDRDDLWYGPPAGLPSLRAALAEYLGRARGVRCTPEQVVVTTGTQQAIDLISRLLVEADDVVVVEDPCYPGARRVFEALGATPAGCAGRRARPAHRRPAGCARPAGLHHALAPVPERRNACRSAAGWTCCAGPSATTPW